MKYCKKCKHIHNDSEEKCSACGRALAEIPEENTPVYLLSASGFELQRVKAALEDSKIPCDTVRHPKNPSAEAVTGYDMSEMDILVPFSAYEKSYDVCVGIGAIKEENEEILDDELQNGEDNPETLDEQFEEMSGVKRTTFRVISAILFLLLIALVVYGTDAITGFIKGLL